MSRTVSKWLTGCGIGCGAALLLLVILGTGGYIFIKSRMHGFAEAEKAGVELENKYGKMEDFCPDPAGRIASERIRAFLEARDRCAPARRRLETSFTSLSEGIRAAKEGQDSIPQIVGIIQRGFEALPELGEFRAARARAMMDSGMGPGEYVYIYVIAYYSWLGKSPGDGPEFRVQQQPTAVEESKHGRDIRAERREQLSRHIRRVILPMLRNQHVRLVEGLAEAAPDPWRDALEAEISALEASHERLPWQDGLPRSLQDSLAPFRERLMESYSPLTNPMEAVFRN